MLRPHVYILIAALLVVIYFFIEKRYFPAWNYGIVMGILIFAIVLNIKESYKEKN